MITTEREQTPAVSTRLAVDPDHTVVDFAVKTFWGLATVRGRFDRFDGSYEIGPDGASIELTIDADSLDTGNATRDRHLRSADFFHVAEHPLVRFASTRVVDVGNGILHVEGDLEAAGTVMPLRFDAVVRPVGDELEVEAATAVDHRGFGMSGGRLGMIRPPARMHVRARLATRASGEASSLEPVAAGAEVHQP
jgi:polyisoprenoid-binding protein YceI